MRWINLRPSVKLIKYLHQYRYIYLFYCISVNACSLMHRTFRLSHLRSTCYTFLQGEHSMPHGYVPQISSVRLALC